MRIPKLVLWSLIPMTLGIVPAGEAADAGSAKGSLKVRGNTVAITHVYALRYDNDEGLLQGPEVRVLLADREVSPALLSDWLLDRLEKLARQGQIRGVLLKLNPSKPGSQQGTLLYPSDDPQQTSTRFFTMVGGDAEKLKIERDDVVGEARNVGNKEYEYAVSIRAPIRPDEPVTARLKGKAALESPQVQTFLASETAMRAGDLEAARPLTAPESFKAIEEYVKQVGEAAYRETMKNEIPPTGERLKEIREVVVRGDRALIVLQRPEGKTAVTLAQVAGKWLMD